MPSSDYEGSDDRKNLEQGRKFEKLAGKFYEQLGFEVIQRNWQAGHKEIDLIVRNEELLVFVEVKSSYSDKFGHPAERVDERKQKNLITAARQFLIAEKIVNTDLRFDVVTFVNGQLEHFPDAFTAQT